MISKIKIGNTEYDIWPVKGIEDGHIPSSYVSCWVGNDLPVTYKDFWSWNIHSYVPPVGFCATQLDTSGHPLEVTLDYGGNWGYAGKLQLTAVLYGTATSSISGKTSITSSQLPTTWYTKNRHLMGKAWMVRACSAWDQIPHLCLYDGHGAYALVESGLYVGWEASYGQVNVGAVPTSWSGASTISFSQPIQGNTLYCQVVGVFSNPEGNAAW